MKIFKTITHVLPLAALVALVACAPLRAGYVLEGTVSDGSGAPVAGVTVRLGGDSDIEAVSAADGSYTIAAAPYGAWQAQATKPGYVFAPRNDDPYKDGAMVFLGATQTTRLDFVAADAGSVTISMIQGRGFSSPLQGQAVRNVVGVITQVTRKAPHSIYETLLGDGTTTPQWISEDGFYIEAFDTYKDGDPLTSDGVFVYTHNDAYLESKWLDSVPPDLAVGDVVSVSGVVNEFRPKDRFNNSEGYLTVTRIEKPTVIRVTEAGVPVKKLTSFPAGVLLTYDDDPSATLPAGVTEWRSIPWGAAATGPLSLRNASLIFESVEGMVVRVDNPLASTSTYYNVTGILPDGGQKDGVDNPSQNAQWKGVVLQDPGANGMDFNADLLFCDYQKPTWKTFDPIPQTGDRLQDSTDAFVLRGVMDYTFDALYMIKPLQDLPVGLTAAGGAAIPNQGWDFYDIIGDIPDMMNLSSANRTAIRNWRIGDTADARFRAPASWGPATEAGIVKVASFNIENFEVPGSPYYKERDIADVIINNLRAPDVVVVVEMGDDKASTIVYVNQDNAYAIPDGVVTSVLNFRSIVDSLKTKSGIQYDFRCIDPEENRDGGEPGTNIRVGFLFRTDTVEFVDRGMPTNHMLNTGGYAGPALPSDQWPVTFPSALSMALSQTPTAVVRDPVDGQAMLTQSPGRIIGAPFAGSTRKPLVGEFIHKATLKKFFVVAAHLGSKSGDTPLYGEQQPPVFGSDARRAGQGAGIARLVSQILDVDSAAKVVVAGDMNDFPWADSMRALTGVASGARVLYSPTAEFMPANEQWSYAFRGNLQQIDHIFVSASIDAKMRADGAVADWTTASFFSHIDAPFSRNNHIQTSDHDPLVVRFRIGD